MGDLDRRFDVRDTTPDLSQFGGYISVAVAVVEVVFDVAVVTTFGSPPIGLCEWIMSSIRYRLDHATQIFDTLVQVCRLRPRLVRSSDDQARTSEPSIKSPQTW